jgi:hypothetical protein
MAVVKNKSTDRDREFWSHVEAVAQQVRDEYRTESACDSRTDGEVRTTVGCPQVQQSNH